VGEAGVRRQSGAGTLTWRARAVAATPCPGSLQLPAGGRQRLAADHPIRWISGWSRITASQAELLTQKANDQLARRPQRDVSVALKLGQRRVERMPERGALRPILIANAQSKAAA